MKKNLSLLSYLVIAISLIFTACKGKKDDPTPEEQQLSELSATWNVTTATPSGFDAVTLTGVTATFTTDKTYTISGLSVLEDNNLNHGGDFAASGSFTLSGDNAEILTLGGGGEFTITSVNQETGSISLTYSAPYPKATDNEVSISITGALQ